MSDLPNPNLCDGHGDAGADDAAPQPYSVITCAQYDMVEARRCTSENLMWQTPVLALTAQAFLFTIALDGGAASAARLVAAVLALCTSAASVQTLVKHRFNERTDSRLLKRYEAARSLPIIHGKRPGGGFLVKLSSWGIWTGTLAAFGTAALIVIIDVIFQLGLFSSARPGVAAGG